MMSTSRRDDPAPRGDLAFQRFLQRVWRDDVGPLLRGRQADQRRKAARIGGTVAGTGGALLDRMLGLRGRPFSRAMTVLGSTLGAILPDAWDWNWLRKAAPHEREAVAEEVQRRAANLPDADALEL